MEINCIDDYIDFGDAAYVCVHCNTKLSYKEMSGKKRKENPPKFSQCCSNEKIQLPKLKAQQQTLQNLLKGNDAKSKHFIKNIRAYNMMFSFTSMGGEIDDSINKCSGSYVFKLGGENYHQIGTRMHNLPTASEVTALISGDIDITMEKEMRDEHLSLIYTVEFQKRGLPHAHILLFLSRENKISNPDDVNQIISAEYFIKKLILDYIDDVLQISTVEQSMFLAWMKFNKENEWARELTYIDFPLKCIWDNKNIK
ncbi:hypothetical protein ACS0TY_012267 [Phlomoides rotata]